MPEKVSVSHRAGDVARSEPHRGTVMSKRKSGKRSKLAASAKGSRRKIATILVMLALIAAGVTAASWSVIKSRSAEPQPQQPSLAKEYIYAGGRLIATEEDVSTTILPPGSLRATTQSNTIIRITWSPSSGAARYQLERSLNFAAANNGFTIVSSTITQTLFDDTVASSAAYIYRVRAVDQNNQLSQPSNIDLAAAMTFDDPSLQGATIREVHLTQLRQAVNFIRQAAGYAAFNSWTDPPPLAQTVNVKKAHVDELRNKLNEAATTLSLPAPTYATITQQISVVEAEHFLQLRRLAKGYLTEVVGN